MDVDVVNDDVREATRGAHGADECVSCSNVGIVAEYLEDRREYMRCQWVVEGAHFVEQPDGVREVAGATEGVDEVEVVDGGRREAEAGHPEEHGVRGVGEVEVGGVYVQEEGEGGAVGGDVVGEHVVEEGRGVGGAAGLGEGPHGGGVGDGCGCAGGRGEAHAAEHAERRVAVTILREHGQEAVVVVEGARRGGGGGGVRGRRGGGAWAVGAGEESAERAHGRAHHGVQRSGGGGGRPCAGGHRGWRGRGDAEEAKRNEFAAGCI